MQRKKLSAAVAVLIVAQLIAVACYVSSSRYCPGSANRGTATCSFDQGTGGGGNNPYSYPWVATSASGVASAQSDKTNHCHYTCPDGTNFWAFPGAIKTGNSCTM